MKKKKTTEIVVITFYGKYKLEWKSIVDANKLIF
jgi:hypothetical protein